VSEVEPSESERAALARSRRTAFFIVGAIALIVGVGVGAAIGATLAGGSALRDVEGAHIAPQDSAGRIAEAEDEIAELEREKDKPEEQRTQLPPTRPPNRSHLRRPDDFSMDSRSSSQSASFLTK